MTRIAVLVVSLALLGAWAQAADDVAGEAPQAAVDDSITVEVVGTLKTGVVAIGAETTGVTITSGNITWELELGERARLKNAAEMLNGKKVRVRGTLERRQGVEIQERWIVNADRLRPAAVEKKE